MVDEKMAVAPATPVEDSIEREIADVEVRCREHLAEDKRQTLAWIHGEFVQTAMPVYTRRAP
jgi:hypothetical protein